jgi:type IV pilus assembly protein PilC
MPKFTYTAIDSRGREKAGDIEAATAEHAAASLKAMGLFPTEVGSGGGRPAAGAAEVKRKEPKPAAPAPAAAPAKRSLWRIKIGRAAGPKAVSLFTRQLSTMLHAGMPLMRALELLARQERNAAFKEVMETVADTIRSGGTLSDGLAQHSRVFDRLYINMVKAGEASGKLDVALDRLSRFQEKALHLKGKIKSAMVYPVIVMTFALVILIALLAFVVPIFEKIFADLLKGAPLPVLTQVVLGASNFVKGHFPVAVCAAAALWIAFRFFRNTKFGARLIDTALIRLPPFGELFLKSTIARFSRTLGTLLDSGVPILQALLITRDTSANVRVMEALTYVHDRVKEGDPVAGPLEAAKLFQPMVTGMIEVGEHTGQLPDMLTKIADIYDEEVDNAVAGLTSVIEPIMIVMLAGIVGTIVVAILLPIVRIVQMLS